MAITFVEERKKQKKLIWILIIVISITAVIWLSRFLKKPSFLIIKRPVFELKKVEIDFEILKKPILKELQPFEKIKSYEGETRRLNPFIPLKP